MRKAKATINIDPEIHKQLKIKAVKEEVSLGELAGRMLRKALEQEKEEVE